MLWIYLVPMIINLLVYGYITFIRVKDDREHFEEYGAHSQDPVYYSDLVVVAIISFTPILNLLVLLTHNLTFINELLKVDSIFDVIEKIENKLDEYPIMKNKV